MHVGLSSLWAGSTTQSLYGDGHMHSPLVHDRHPRAGMRRGRGSRTIAPAAMTWTRVCAAVGVLVGEIALSDVERDSCATYAQALLPHEPGTQTELWEMFQQRPDGVFIDTAAMHADILLVVAPTDPGSELAVQAVAIASDAHVDREAVRAFVQHCLRLAYPSSDREGWPVDLKAWCDDRDIAIV
jgi:hypothetical protein